MTTAKTDGFPRVRADKAFKEKAFKACEENNVTYAQAVRILMQKLIEGKIAIETNEDYDFEKSAKVALNSKSTKKALRKLADNFSPDRVYSNVKKA